MIVCATREICARLYEEIIALRPEWHSDDVDKGKIKVVYSSSSSDSGLIAKHPAQTGAEQDDPETHQGRR